MSTEGLVPKEQQRLLEAVEAVNIAYLMTGDTDNDIQIAFHNQAINNSPGWNIFLKNMRFEFGYQQSKVRFSLPPDEEKFENFKIFLENSLCIKNYSVTPRIGIKYILEIELEDYIYDDDGIVKITQLTNKILECS